MDVHNTSFSSVTTANLFADAYNATAKADVYNAIVSEHSNIGGAWVGIFTFAFTVACELCSFQHVRRVWQQPGGRVLYAYAIFYNVLNVLIVGPAIWWVAADLLCAPPLPSLACIGTMCGLLAAHSIGYYMGHAAMHRPEFYRFHKLHHRFHTHVTPSAANCVTIVEFTVAYMLPFIVGICLFRPDRLALLRAVSIISFNNILIHTPALAAPAERWLPSIFVGTDFHMEHHARLTTKYAAPTINVDYLLERLSDAFGVSKPHWPGPKPRKTA